MTFAIEFPERWSAQQPLISVRGSNVLPLGAFTGYTQFLTDALGNPSVYDNSVTRYATCAIETTVVFTVAPSQNDEVRLYLVYAPVGGTFEDANDFIKSPPAAHYMLGDALWQKMTVENVPLFPFQFKIFFANRTPRTIQQVLTTIRFYEEQQFVQ